MECPSLELIEERHQECLALLDRIALEKRSRLMGTVQEVLIEEDGFGRTRTNYKVRVQGDVSPGELVRAKITDVQRATLVGDIP
jgi:tRNA A37 methylthiotransferase MiaB